MLLSSPSPRVPKTQIQGTGLTYPVGHPPQFQQTCNVLEQIRGFLNVITTKTVPLLEWSNTDGPKLQGFGGNCSIFQYKVTIQKFMNRAIWREGDCGVFGA